ncbi:serine/arginine-rich splicing factor SR45a-like isoform X3 [Olea europaea var. sylvestris]|uniref:serine/arginine-rich splicing factor SR45a-like isoform X2 n=1 Tax=Olea europaea var. sylvestris TaxID=158386 RepID=UPI000C1D6EEB|nr:serine/arginine-rich splicing factor SR45a-like isoform X2 [Olea europaea var. sylvestris]XP_022879765.1 serine/arginine-rich splicing factor SR45a-like isoform X3 [Olea europaea var. sylvestris]
MADSPRKRYALSPSPRDGKLRSRSRSESRSPSRSWSRPSDRSRSRSRSRSRNRGRSDAINPGDTLYVTGLSMRVTERDLEDHFSKEGKVKSVFLVVEPRSRVSRGFAFITMDSAEDANRCVKHLNQSVLEGRYITVEKSRRKRARTPTPGHYLGLKNSRGDGYRGNSGGYRRVSSRDDYGYRRSPMRSPYRGEHDYSPRRSTYRDERDYSPRRLPYRGERDYSPRPSPYGRRSRSDR